MANRGRRCKARQWLRSAVFLLAHALPAPAADLRLWEVVAIEAAALPQLVGIENDSLAVVRCEESGCEPVPFQIDERDGRGKWVLEHGPATGADDVPGVFDANDVLLFYASDAGSRAAGGGGFGAASRVVEVELRDPLGFPSRWVYVLARRGQAPTSNQRYVFYDPSADRIQGARVVLGFAAGVPRYLALGDGRNLLDRLKVRATAFLLWGLIQVQRSEADLASGPVSWKAGPVRVIRRQEHSVRVGFGIRSPRFGSYTYFYRDFAELPVSMRLRVPPRFFFTAIQVRSVLDFRGLPGPWEVVAPWGESVAVECHGGGADPGSITGRPGDWIALRGAGLTLVQRLRRGPSLTAVRERLWYRADGEAPDPPEDQRGMCPGFGFVLDGWEAVEGGRHSLLSESYALPGDVDLALFLAAADNPLQVRPRTLR